MVEYRSAESESLTFASSWGLRNFLFPRLVTRRKAPFSKNSYFHISLVEVEQRRDTIIFLRTFMLCLFLNWHLQWGQFPSSPLLCQESFCFTNIRLARYVDNTGTENQCQYEFPHFPVTVPTGLLWYWSFTTFPSDLRYMGSYAGFPFFVSFQMKISWKEMLLTQPAYMVSFNFESKP